MIRGRTRVVKRPGGGLVGCLVQVLFEEFAVVSRVTHRLKKFGGEPPPCIIVERRSGDSALVRSLQARTIRSAIILHCCRPTDAEPLGKFCSGPQMAACSPTAERRRFLRARVVEFGGPDPLKRNAGGGKFGDRGLLE